MADNKQQLTNQSGPLIQLTVTSATSLVITAAITTARISNPTLVTSEQDESGKLDDKIIAWIKENTQQTTKLLRRKMTLLHQDMMANPEPSEKLRERYYTLKGNIAEQVREIESRNKITGQIIDEFWTEEYDQKWKDIDEQFRNIFLFVTDKQTLSGDNTEEKKEETLGKSDFPSKFEPRMIDYIPEFGGELLDFETFWNMFVMYVDSKNIPNDEKKALLMLKLINTPRIIVRALSSYDQMKSALLIKYRNPISIRNKYLSMLIKISPIKSIKQSAELETLLETMEMIMIGMDANAADQTTMDLVKTLLLDRIPPETQLRLCLNKISSRKDIVEIMLRIRQDINVNERMYLNDITPPGPSKDKWDKGKKKSQKQKSNSDVKCEFCGEKHYAVRCNGNKSLTEKEAIIKEKGLCKLCLRKGHRLFDCKSQFVCPCGTKHSVQVCPKRSSTSLVVENKTSTDLNLVKTTNSITDIFRIFHEENEEKNILNMIPINRTTLKNLFD